MAEKSSDHSGSAAHTTVLEQAGAPAEGSTGGSLDWRARLSIILLVLVAVLAQIRGSVAVRQSPPGAEVGRYEARYTVLRTMLPASGTVGYVSDYPPLPLNSVGETAFYHAQYSLAPTVVARTTEHDLVVGNFLDPTTDPAQFAVHGLTLVFDTGNGVVLFRRQPDL